MNSRIPHTALVLLLLLGALTGMAQPNTRDHRLRCDQPLTAAGMKYVQQAVNDLDPAGRVAIDGRLIKVRVHAGVDVQTLLAVLNATGAATFSAGWPVADVDRSGTHPTGFPNYVDTGDPIQDSIVFATAKQAWATAHPEYFMSNKPPTGTE